MLITAFFSWWYGTGWKQVAHSTQARMDGVLAAFSVPALLRTLFAPWRRIVTPPGTTIGDHARAALDNTVSRFVGFGVRIIILIASGAALAGIGLFGLLQIVAWPFLPPAVIILLFMGIAQ